MLGLIVHGLGEPWITESRLQFNVAGFAFFTSTILLAGSQPALAVGGIASWSSTTRASRTFCFVA